MKNKILSSYPGGVDSAMLDSIDRMLSISIFVFRVFLIVPVFFEPVLVEYLFQGFFAAIMHWGKSFLILLYLAFSL